MKPRIRFEFESTELREFGFVNVTRDFRDRNGDNCMDFHLLAELVSKNSRLIIYDKYSFSHSNFQNDGLG